MPPEFNNFPRRFPAHRYLMDGVRATWPGTLPWSLFERNLSNYDADVVEREIHAIMLQRFESLCVIFTLTCFTFFSPKRAERNAGMFRWNISRIDRSVFERITRSIGSLINRDRVSVKGSLTSVTAKTLVVGANLVRIFVRTLIYEIAPILALPGSITRR